MAKTVVCQKPQGDTITNLTAKPVRLHCSHQDSNVSMGDVGSNYMFYINNTVFNSDP